MRGHSVYLALLVALAAALYARTLPTPFVFDDVQNVVLNDTIAHLGRFNPLGGEERYGPVGGPRALLMPRYLGNLSLAVNYAIGGRETWGYRAVNVGLHLANVCLAYALCLLLLRGEGEGRAARLAAFFGAVLFAAHPLQTQVVTYVAQRFAAMAAAFYLASFLLYARWLEGGGRRHYAAALLAAVCAAKSKETAFTIPFMLALYDMAYHKTGLRMAALRALPFLSVMALIPLSFLSVGAGGWDGASVDIGGAVELTTTVQSTLTRAEYLATQARVVLTYLRLLLLPVGQNIDYDYPAMRSLSDPFVLGSAALLGAGLAAGAFLLLRAVRRPGHAWRAAGFGAAWFFVTISVESSLIPIADVIAEQRVYLPSAGIFAAAASAALHAIHALRVKRGGRALARPVFVGLVLAICLFAASTLARNALWADDLALWRDAALKSPYKPRVQYNLGAVYLERGRAAEAMPKLRRAIELNPSYVDAHVNLGIAYEALGMRAEALAAYERAIALGPGYSPARYNHGLALSRVGRTGEAIAEMTAALALDGQNYQAMNARAALYLSIGNAVQGLDDAEEAVYGRPDMIEAHLNMGAAYLMLGRPDHAIQSFRRALDLDPGYADAHFNMGLALLDAGDRAGARESFRRALALDPGFEAAEEHLSRLEAEGHR